MKGVLQNFRWIDDIPEDQNKRDEICVEARAALLLEANVTSEMMPAFLRQEKGWEGSRLPEPISFDLKNPYENQKTVITLEFFEFGELNDIQKLWGPQHQSASPGNLYRSYSFNA